MAHAMSPVVSRQCQTLNRPVVFRSPKCTHSRQVVARVAAKETATSEASTSDDKTWYACVANATFMLNDIQNESFAEQLREKTRHYKDNGKELDFFLVCEPEWLDKQHPDAAKRIGRPSVALIGRDKTWITFMKLRLDRVMMLEVSGTMEEVTKCGAPVPEFERLDKQKGWVAPYSPYAPGWWNVFMPGKI